MNEAFIESSESQQMEVGSVRQLLDDLQISEIDIGELNGDWANPNSALKPNSA